VVKFIDDPEQTGEFVVTTGVVGIALTVVVIAFDVAGLPETPTKVEVITHVTI
jgi:hypothetical protein